MAPEGAPLPASPRKRGEGQAVGRGRRGPLFPLPDPAPTAARFGPAGARSGSDRRQARLPPPLAGEGWGGGRRCADGSGGCPPPPPPPPAGGGGLGGGQAGRRWLRRVPPSQPPPASGGRGRPAVGRGSRCDAGGGRARGSILAGLPTHGSTRMTDTLRIAMAQFDFPVGDVAGNASRIAAMIGEARDEFGADIVLFPELAVSGYPPEDLLMRPSFLADCDRAMREVVARAARGIVAVVGWPESAGSVLYNSASVLRDGRIEATYRKRELPNHDVFDERRY